MSEEFPGPDFTLDTTLGVILTTCLIVGLAGNVSAFLFFWQNRHTSLPDKVYCVVSCVDVITNLTAISTISFLFSARDASLCTDTIVNGIFLVSTRFSTKLSMFLVAVLSTSRSIAIIAPLRSRDIRSAMVMKIIAGFAILVTLMDLIPISVGWVVPSHDVSGCNFLKLTPATSRHISIMIQTFDQTVIFTTSLTVFISFIAGVLGLWRKSSIPQISSSRVSLQVTITVTLFTALFLVCNLPYSCFYMLMILRSHVPAVTKTVGGYHEGWFYWNGPIMFIVVPVSFNAALNPCFYMLRMPRFRAQVYRWIRHVLGKILRNN